MLRLNRPTIKKLSRPNGKKATARISKELDALLERAPVKKDDALTYMLRPEAEMFKAQLIAYLFRMYE